MNVLKALKALGADRVCFGSDTPFNLMHVEVAAYRALMDGELSEADQAKVMAGNIARVLGIG
ncbi:MAG: amidohydrolase family protein [Chloroflexi bacterium]|nr:amidohydrolase family protein [Chloroflexota bacterium]